MTDKPHDRPVAAPSATVATTATDGGAAAARLALLMAPGTETDHLAVDTAHDVALSVLQTMQLEDGVTAQATERAVRVLMLAAASLRWDIAIEGRGLFVSTLLLAMLDEQRDQLVAPPSARAQPATERLRGAAAAGLRGDSAPPGQGLRLVVPAGMAGVAKEWLGAFKPVDKPDDGDAPPPIAA